MIYDFHNVDLVGGDITMTKVSADIKLKLYADIKRTLLFFFQKEEMKNYLQILSANNTQGIA